MRRPSIVFINRVYPPVRGATGRILSDLARSFAREGWQVTVITTGPKALSERDGAVRVIRVKAVQNPSGVLAYFWILLKLLFAAMRLPATHLVVTMTDPPLLVLAGRILQVFKKNRHMHWCQDLYPDVLPALGSGFPRFIMRFVQNLARGAMQKADKVVVVGRCMAQHLGHDGFDKQQITFIPNWPDFELIRPEGEAEESRGIGGDLPSGHRSHEEQLKYGPKFRVLYAGNIGLAHPIDTIIGAAEILNATHPEIEFVFVGEGPRFDQIARERARRHIENIRLLPYQPVSRLKELMESGDLHLISMKEEAAGMVVPSKIYAAIAAHRPCLMVGPGMSETGLVITEFGAGSVVGQGDPQRLAEEIRQYRLDRDKWFKAYEGAQAAARVFVSKESIKAWIERAEMLVESSLNK